MRKLLILGGGVVVLLFAALTACSDGLSAGDDDPLADRVDYIVYGITYQMISAIYGIPHEAEVGLRHVYANPYTTYIYTTTSDEDTGYYEFLLNQLDTAWYACDAWFEEGNSRWQGSSSDFFWNKADPHSFPRDIKMYEVE
ncbi:MAG: hypothetical protein NTW26_02055 [bacterium]|nr:hypothetical protein [bacterium]